MTLLQLLIRLPAPGERALYHGLYTVSRVMLIAVAVYAEVSLWRDSLMHGTCVFTH